MRERELDEETPRRRPRYIQCADGSCGADDCPNCRPGNFQDGVLVDVEFILGETKQPKKSEKETE